MRKRFGLVDFITLFLVLGAFACLTLPYFPVLSPKVKWLVFEKPEANRVLNHLISSLEEYRSVHGQEAIPPSLDVLNFPPNAKRISPFVVDYPLSVVRARLHLKEPVLSVEVGPYRKTRRHWYDGTEGYEFLISLKGNLSPRCVGLYNACHNRFNCLNPHAPKDGWLDICLVGERL
ncbi:MAG: hypothetical protein E7027_06835 [Elusimicrobium sp.]|uniref:Uncharacterized protein n=1 Tax=Candidatus Avelusimicrobium gallicola TaxID=2562704 RepID=A0A928DSD0_9BACT|nr:hypothetical protein [Elusimicrobium sp.]